MSEAAGELTLLVIPVGTVTLALEAASVLSIEPEREWEGAPPLDLAVATVGDAATGGDPRVLRIDRASRPPLPLLVTGTMRLLSVARETVVPLPAILAAHAPWISAVVLADDGALVIVDCEQLS